MCWSCLLLTARVCSSVLSGPRCDAVLGLSRSLLCVCCVACCHCLQQRQADVALSNRRLAELRDEISRRQGQLDSLEALYAERQESLRQTAHELACRRGELSTLESSLSESLRRKADAEYHALEERLRRYACRSRPAGELVQCSVCCTMHRSACCTMRCSVGLLMLLTKTARPVAPCAELRTTLLTDGAVVGAVCWRVL